MSTPRAKRPPRLTLEKRSTFWGGRRCGFWWWRGVDGDFDFDAVARAADLEFDLAGAGGPAAPGHRAHDGGLAAFDEFDIVGAEEQRGGAIAHALGVEAERRSASQSWPFSTVTGSFEDSPIKPKTKGELGWS